jgi:hypothetical protein
VLGFFQPRLSNGDRLEAQNGANIREFPAECAIVDRHDASIFLSSLDSDLSFIGLGKITSPRKSKLEKLASNLEEERTMRIKKFAGFVMAMALLFAALALGVSAGTVDQQSGTWMMNAANSKYSPGPAPKSNTVKIEADAENLNLNSDGIDAAGKPTHVEYTAKFDGKDYPVTGAPNTDTVALMRVDANTIQSTLKKAGEVVMTVKTVISTDGKTRTSTFTGKDAQGHDVNNIVAYDKL